MLPIVKAPFYGTHCQVSLTQICSGAEVDATYNCLDANGQSIP
ncbi:hypothetical protein [Streptococcus sp. X13SY08]|nr:hypothetical protein [Streptococcus sp. X13SY08]